MDLVNDTKRFLTPANKRRNNIYIVDADNYQANISKILSSKKTVLLVCLSSSDAITTGIYHQLTDKTKSMNKLHIYRVSPGRDSTDIFMASLLGYFIAKYGTDFNYYLISRDHIFENLKTEYTKLGYSVETLTEIEVLS